MATILSYVRPLFCFTCFIIASCILGIVDPTDMYSQRQHSVLRTIRDESADYLMSYLLQECRRMRYNPAGTSIVTLQLPEIFASIPEYSMSSQSAHASDSSHGT